MLRRTVVAGAAVCAAVLLILLVQSQRSRTIFQSDSEFGAVRVTERSDGLRSLYTGEGRARQSAIYPDRPLHLEHAYTRVGMIALALMPPDGRILFVGLGGGAMPTYARQVLPDAVIDVVEIDPVIVAVAQRYFGFTPDHGMRVHTGDGRAFIERAPAGTYDVIVLDAFSDDEVPYSLTTRQFLAAVRAALTPRGAVVSNLWTAAPAYPSMLATYAAVFDQVHLLRVPRRAQRILVAGTAAPRLDRTALVQAATALADRVELGFDLPALVVDGYEALPPRRRQGPVLEDRTSSREPAMCVDRGTKQRQPAVRHAPAAPAEPADRHVMSQAGSDSHVSAPASCVSYGQLPARRPPSAPPVDGLWKTAFRMGQLRTMVPGPGDAHGT